MTPEKDVSRIPAPCQLAEPQKTSEDGSGASPGRCEDRDDGSACSRLKWDYGISKREKRRISSTASTVSSMPASRSFTSLIVSDPPSGAEGGPGVFCSPSISTDETPARPVFFRHKVLRPTPELTSPPEFDLGLFLVRTAAVSKHTDDVAPLLEDPEVSECGHATICGVEECARLDRERGVNHLRERRFCAAIQGFFFRASTWH